MTKRRKTTSGTRWTEADYQAHGYAMIKLRLPAETKERIKAQAKARGVSVAAMVASWVEIEPVEPE